MLVFDGDIEKDGEIRFLLCGHKVGDIGHVSSEGDFWTKSWNFWKSLAFFRQVGFFPPLSKVRANPILKLEIFLTDLYARNQKKISAWNRIKPQTQQRQTCTLTMRH